MRGRTWITARLLGLTIAAVAIAGCDEPPEPGSVVEPVGSVSLTLAVSPGLHIDSVAYAIDRAAYHLTGSLNLSSSNVLSGTISPIPPGTGYALSLDASNVAGELPRVHCTGSTTFDVSAGATTPATVSMRCKEEKAAAPAVAVPLSSPAGRWSLALALVTIGAVLSRRHPARWRS